MCRPYKMPVSNYEYWRTEFLRFTKEMNSRINAVEKLKPRLEKAKKNMERFEKETK